MVNQFKILFAGSITSSATTSRPVFAVKEPVFYGEQDTAWEVYYNSTEKWTEVEDNLTKKRQPNRGEG